MIELSFGELKQGLMCCTVYRDCKSCPLFDEGKGQTATVGDWSCTMQLMAAAMNCINVMEKDLANITHLAGRWEEACTECEKELYELRESLDRRAINNEKL